MRYLVISDLHSNWEALTAVSHAAHGEYDRILCCGDVVGYGPDPERVIEWTRTNADVVIRGNHDRACCGLESLEWFSPVAKAAALWTKRRLSSTDREYLHALPTGPFGVDDFQLAHGSPLDEDEYLLDLEAVRDVFAAIETSVVFFGHTHLQGGFVWAKGRYSMLSHLQGFPPDVHHHLDPDGSWLINPGSVGQPRDGDPRAAFAFYDTVSRDVILRRVEYDFDATRRKIEAAGLPDVLGIRLAAGR